MPWQRKYDFKNGTFIDADQVDDEFNQLIAAANGLESTINQKDSDLRKLAQLSKLTSDAGGVKVSVSTTTGDLLEELLKKGAGVHTFYAISNSKNMPPSNKSIRGLAHFTSADIGWVWAIDYANNFFTNYYDAGSWKGWKTIVSDKDTSPTLWTGAIFLQGGHTVKPTKKLSDCRNGWVLVWSDYDPSPTAQANNYDVVYSFIPKNSAFISGHQNMFIVPNYQTATTTSYVIKKAKVFNDRLEGYDDNSASATSANDVVLRNILEW